jgi:hypothetical protein
MADTSSNGHISRMSPTDLIHDEFARTKRGRSDHEIETEQRKRRSLDQISELHDERQRAMVLASSHAGNIGLIYDARNNSFSRVVIVDELPPVDFDRPEFEAIEAHTSESDIAALPERGGGEAIQDERPLMVIPDSERPEMPEFREPAPPTLPERPAMPEPREISDRWERNTFWKSVIAWVASLLVGAFVGFGLLNLTGLPYRRPGDWLNLYGFIAIGIGAIAGMKLLFDAMWHEAGRRKALGISESVYTVACTAVSTIILAVEATLGGEALVYYTRRASFENKGELPLWQMIMLAVAISTANLLYSAFVGYQKGLRSVTREDMLKQQYDRDMAEYDHAVAIAKEHHAQRVLDWKEDLKRQDLLKQKSHEQKEEGLRHRQEIEQSLHDLRVKAVEDRKSAHDEALERWRNRVDAVANAHGEGIAQRQERSDEYESYRKLPDFQALCKCIGLIGALDVRIEEIERQANNEAISRGYARKALY